VNERPIFLVVYMGSGKTAVGQALARGLAWDFEDIDARVQLREALSVREIFERFGEAGFREREWRALRELGPRPRCVVATGGGLYAQAAPRRWMEQHGRTVWLDCPAREVRRRIASSADRPLWDADDPVAWRARFERRRAAYALARFRVEASGADPQEVARRVAQALGQGAFPIDSGAKLG
jgi:shikimate kinase